MKKERIIKLACGALRANHITIEELIDIVSELIQEAKECTPMAHEPEPKRTRGQEVAAGKVAICDDDIEMCNILSWRINYRATSSIIRGMREDLAAIIDTERADAVKEERERFQRGQS